jgi:hypothetical protein
MFCVRATMYEHFRGMCCIHFTSLMKVETACSSETFVPIYHSVWHYNPEDVDYLCLDTVVCKYILFFFLSVMELKEQLCLMTWQGLSVGYVCVFTRQWIQLSWDVASHVVVMSHAFP